MKWISAPFALVTGGLGLQRAAEARDRRRFPPPGRYLHVGDAMVHVVVDGTGPPVLIDSGLGGSSIEWARVANDLAHDFTVIRYDRPGFAWSPDSQCDRRAVAAAGRIVALLEGLGVRSPAILVGHSLGGVHVRVAAALRPDLVGGLVLVDPSHEGMLAVIESSKAAATMQTVMRVLAWLAPTGLARLAGRQLAKMTLAEHRQPLDPADAGRAKQSELLTSRTVHGLRGLAAEHTCLEASLRQMLELSGSVPDVPMTLITAGASSPNQKIADARTQIDAMHAELVAASRHGTHVFAERSGHLVPLDQPELITQCVRETAAAMEPARSQP